LSDIEDDDADEGSDGSAASDDDDDDQKDNAADNECRESPPKKRVHFADTDEIEKPKVTMVSELQTFHSTENISCFKNVYTCNILSIVTLTIDMVICGKFFYKIIYG